jgi:hypothetical protein
MDKIDTFLSVLQSEYSLYRTKRIMFTYSNMLIKIPRLQEGTETYYLPGPLLKLPASLQYSDVSQGVS